jgi:S-formylglutathione hydrolase FrmB
MAKESKSIKSSIVRIGIGVALLLLFALFILFIICLIKRPIPLPLPLINKFAPWEDTIPVYEGEGKLMVYMSSDDPLLPIGNSTTKYDPIYSMLLRKDRPLIVYLPPGYKKVGEPYPVIFALHGFAGRGQSWASLLIDPLEHAIKDGVIPPAIVVFPDFSISGDSSDNPKTKYDERGGSFYINSNLGRFEDHFFKEIVPFVFSNFNVRTDPNGIVMMGSSMGGFATIYYAVTHPRFSHILVPIFPAADLRYGIGGNKLADYDAENYALIDNDNPTRIVNGAVMGGLFGITEEWIYNFVFDSDKIPGDVWNDDKPVWERIMSVNPVEIINGIGNALYGQSYYIIVGDKDDFNFDAHVPILLPLLKNAGAGVEDVIIPGGRHNLDFVNSHIDEILAWIGEELTESKE